MDGQKPTIDPQNAPPDGTEPGHWSRLLNFGGRRRITPILQAEASECGLACIAMIASYYGYRTDLLTLRARFATSLRGARLQDLMDIAEAVGLVPRPVQVELEHLHQLQVPSILHWNMNHFVVLTKVRKKSVEIVDPASGRRTVPISEVNRRFTGVALELDAGPSLQRKDAIQPVSLRKLAGSIHGLGSGLIQIFAMALLLEIFALLAPQFLRLVIDQVVAGGDAALLTLLGVSFLLLLAVRVVVEALRTWTIMWLSANVSMGWTGNVFNHLLKLPLDYFSKRYLGDVISRFGAINVIQQTLTTQFVAVVVDGLMATLTLIMLLYYSWKLAAITLAFTFSYITIRVLYYASLREATLRQINVAAHQQGALIESLRGMQTVRLNNRGAQRAARYMNATADVVNSSIVVQKLSLGFSSMDALVTGSQRVVVIWIGASLALSGQMTMGTIIAFAAYADMLTGRVVGLTDYAIRFRLLRLQGERLADIVLTAPERHVQGTFTGSIPDHGIEFRNLSFQYAHNAKPILRECSFTVGDGEIVALTGISGSGKSTIAKLLLGVMDYTSGSIRIGGVDMRMLGKQRCREIIGSVFQDDEAFSGSLFENISFFDPGATLEKVEKAARKANLGDDVAAMPMGYHTPIGDMGSTLSGGQLQRLLLARALYRDPKILVLDEATSQLDIENERLICDAVRSSGITTVIIAHRPQTIDSADRVLELVDGRLTVKETSRTKEQESESRPSAGVQADTWSDT